MEAGALKKLKSEHNLARHSHLAPWTQLNKCLESSWSRRMHYRDQFLSQLIGVQPFLASIILRFIHDMPNVSIFPVGAKSSSYVLPSLTGCTAWRRRRSFQHLLSLRRSVLHHSRSNLTIVHAGCLGEKPLLFRVWRIIGIM